MSLINIKNLNKVYGKGQAKVYALKDINLSIEKGELVAIVGPSGSGKSTLLNIIGCLDKATSGEYYFNGKLINDFSPIESAKIRNEKIGFIFQNFNLLYKYNLIENVEIPLSYSKNKKNMKKRAIEILKKVELGEYVGNRPDMLSGGQKQRVAIARALVNEPDIILADEPTGALDVATGEKIISLLKEINRDGRTVLIITHDRSIASKCNRIIEIVDGKIKNDISTLNS